MSVIAGRGGEVVEPSIMGKLKSGTLQSVRFIEAGSGSSWAFQSMIRVLKFIFTSLRNYWPVLSQGRTTAIFIII